MIARLLSKARGLPRNKPLAGLPPVPTSEDILSIILPRQVSHGTGGHLVDAGGNHYIDLVSSWGANILGYGYERVAKAVATQISKYANLGTAGPEFALLESLLRRHIPCAERIHLVKNGSDATAAAIRLCRAVTGREMVLHRGYHGVHDWFMASTTCQGIPQALKTKIVSLPALTPEHVRQALKQYPRQFACLIIDPMLLPLADGKMMRTIQEMLQDDGALLVYDEVVSGFRVHVGGMQAEWGVTPDLACFAKAIANGLPLAVLTGRADLIARMPLINYSLTFGLESVSIVAAIETISEIVGRNVCHALAQKGRYLKAAYREMCAARGIPSHLAGHDTRPQIEFDHDCGLQANTLRYLIIQELARHKICSYGTFNLCYSHNEEDLEAICRALGLALDRVQLAMKQPSAQRLLDPAGLGRLPQGSDLDPAQLLEGTPAEVEALVRPFSFEQLDARFADDPWLRNYTLSAWEKAHGKTELHTYPWYLTLGITHRCNARCIFCPQALMSDYVLELSAVPQLRHVLSYAKTLLVTGGEPTVHPRFGSFLGQLHKILDRRAYVCLLTNGTRLDDFADDFERLNIGFCVSLNAATPATHHKLMALGEASFHRIVESIRTLRQFGRHIDLSLVVVRHNLHEIPRFIELGQELGAHALYLRTLNPGDYYSALFATPEEFQNVAPHYHPDFSQLQQRARAAIREAQVPIYGNPDQWEQPLQSAKPAGGDRSAIQRFFQAELKPLRSRGAALPACTQRQTCPAGAVPNPYHRQAPFTCAFPWYATKILDGTLRFNPCGFMTQVAGYDAVGLLGSGDFFELWNSPAMVALRQSLQQGPLLPACLTCPSQL